MKTRQQKEAHRVYMKEWRLNNPEKDAEARARFRNSNRYGKSKSKPPKGYMKNYMRKYNQNLENHRKYLLRQRDVWNLKEGLLEQQNFCSICGSKENLELHHKSYDETKNVILLCRKCHRKIHRKYNKDQSSIKKIGENKTREEPGKTGLVPSPRI